MVLPGDLVRMRPLATGGHLRSSSEVSLQGSSTVRPVKVLIQLPGGRGSLQTKWDGDRTCSASPQRPRPSVAPLSRGEWRDESSDHWAADSQTDVLFAPCLQRAETGLLRDKCSIPDAGKSVEEHRSRSQQGRQPQPGPCSGRLRLRCPRGVHPKTARLVGPPSSVVVTLSVVICFL